MNSRKFLAGARGRACAGAIRAAPARTSRPSLSVILSSRNVKAKDLRAAMRRREPLRVDCPIAHNSAANFSPRRERANSRKFPLPPGEGEGEGALRTPRAGFELSDFPAYVNPHRFGAWRSLVAHLPWAQGVGRSNRLAPISRASSSGGQSNGLLSRGSGVRVPSGAPGALLPPTQFIRRGGLEIGCKW